MDTADKPEPISYAQRSTRCAHVKYNGDTCGCPALHGKPFCRFHQEQDAPGVAAPLLEDAAALQLAIMRVLRALEADRIDTRKATAQLYALQLACQNLSHLRDELPADPDPRMNSLTERVMRILDPPSPKYVDVYRQVRDLVALL